MGLHFDIVDVFTDRPYAGNPLAVVHRARTLTARQMQAIAAEFRLSETAFTLPPTTSRATYRLRIFTPTRELPFAGHPSIGAAWALGFADMIRIGDVVQECGAGLLPVHVDRDGARVVGRNAGGRAGPGRRALARDGGSRPRTTSTRPCPPGVASAGVPFAFLPVRPSGGARGAGPGARSRAATAEQTGLAVVAVDREKGTAHLRMFGPRGRRGRGPGDRARRRSRSASTSPRAGRCPTAGRCSSIAQGAEIGRPSTLTVQVRVAGGAAAEVAVQGGVRMVAKGELLALPERVTSRPRCVRGGSRAPPHGGGGVPASSRHAAAVAAHRGGVARDHAAVTRARRSCLAVPGSSQKFIDKARTLPADQVFLDLEDACAPLAKPGARKTIVAALNEGGWGDAAARRAGQRLDHRVDLPRRHRGRGGRRREPRRDHAAEGADPAAGRRPGPAAHPDREDHGLRGRADRDRGADRERARA